MAVGVEKVKDSGYQGLIGGSGALTDGTYRVMPKAVPQTAMRLALSAVGSSKPTLAQFRPGGDRERWLFRKP